MTTSAAAATAGQALTLHDFDAASRRVGVIVNIRPGGERYLMEDFGSTHPPANSAALTLRPGALTTGVDIGGARLIGLSRRRPSSTLRLLPAEGPL